MKMLRFYISFFLLLKLGLASAQQTYSDSLHKYFNKYVNEHEVVKGDDKEYFSFFAINEGYRVIADFKKATENKWFSIQTSGVQRKTFRVFGTVSFTLHDTLVTLNLYQAQNLLSDPKYKDYLALMFTDKTTGNETYESGRYIDLSIKDIKDNRIVIDFNKAYNPYCAYVKNKYNCPIPPHENDIPLAMRAGEKNFEKKN
jgi:hypothetical protein